MTVLTEEWVNRAHQLAEQLVAGGVTTPILSLVVPPEKLGEAIDALAR